jgi:hypothetical protein
MAIDIGTGSTITATIQSAFFTANLISVSWSGITRRPVATSSMATTGGQTFIPADTYDPGTLEVEFQFDPTKSVVTAITGAAENVAVQFGGVAVGLSASGFLTDVVITDPDEELMTARGTIKFSGNITADVTP